jgi:hypothetical protein
MRVYITTTHTLQLGFFSCQQITTELGELCLITTISRINNPLKEQGHSKTANIETDKLCVMSPALWFVTLLHFFLLNIQAKLETTTNKKGEIPSVTVWNSSL